MRLKTARRFVRRNRSKVRLHLMGINRQAPSFCRRYARAYKVWEAAWRRYEEHGEGFFASVR